MARILLVTMMFFCALSPLQADELERALLRQYHEALSKEDAATLMQLIADDARIQIILVQENEEPLTLTLSRDEYLQHLRALWHFADSQTYSQSDLRWTTEVDDFQVSLQQLEHYQLFGKALEQKSRVRLGMATINGAVQIIRIEARTHGW